MHAEYDFNKMTGRVRGKSYKDYRAGHTVKIHQDTGTTIVQHFKLEEGAIIPGDRLMHIITRKRLNEFVAQHPNAKPGLMHWYRTLKSAQIYSFAELRTLVPNVDRVGKLTVFNIGGNTARLVAALHYNRQKVYIRAVLTHNEYDQGKWKE